MSQYVVFMAPEHLRNTPRKASALRSDALTRLASSASLIDVQDLPQDIVWSVWWRAVIETADETTLVLLPDEHNILGFRQAQRAEHARRQGISVYVLRTHGATWALTPFDKLDIQPTEPRTLARFAKITGG